MILRSLHFAIMFALVAPAMASAFSESKTAELFERVRSDLPCMASAAQAAKRSRFRPTGVNQNSEIYTSREFADRSKIAFLLVSYEIRDGNPQNALSVSVYDTDDEFPANLTNAFADIWDLPIPEPLRADPSRAAFHWIVSFPNGDMQIIVSYSPDTKLTQIYGRTINLGKDQASGCSG